MKLSKLIVNSLSPSLAKLSHILFLILFFKTASNSMQLSDYGYLMTYITVMNFFLVFVNFGLTGYTQKVFIDNPEKSQEILSFIFLFKIIASIISVSTIIIFFPSIIFSHIYLIFIILTSFNDLFFDYSFFKNQYKKVFLFQSLINFSITIIIVLFIKIYQFERLDLSISSYSLIYSFPIVILFLYFVSKNLSLIKAYEFNNSFLFRNILKNALPYFILGFVNLMLIRTDAFIIKYYYSSEEVGIYLSISKILDLYYLIPILILSSSKSYLLKLSDSEYFNFVKYYLKIFIMGSISIIFFTILFSKGILKLLYSTEISSSYITLNILILSLLPNSILILFNSFYLRFQNQKILLINTVLVLFMNLAINFILIPTYGINGAAFSSFISFIAAVFLVPLLFDKTRFVPKFIFSVIHK